MAHKTTNAEYEAIMGALSTTSLTERCLILIMSIIKHNSGSVFGPIYGLISVIARMSEEMSLEQKNRVSVCMRDAADRIETLEETTIN